MPFLNTLQCLFSLLVTAEGGKAHITLTRGSETDTRGADDIGSVEQLLEERPGWCRGHRAVRAWSIGGAHPDVGGMLAAITLEAESS